MFLATCFRLLKSLKPSRPAHNRRRAARPRPSFQPRMEQLESRELLTAGLRETYLLDLINQMRENPAATLPRLLNSNDVNVNNALSYFHVNRQVLAQQWATLQPEAPLAWNDTLAGTAFGHTQLMQQFDQQSHQLPGEAGLGDRIGAAGYNFTNVGENIYAFAKASFDTFAGWAIDWGNTPTGIQTPAGHRDNIMSPNFREVGIAMVDQTQSGKQTGPLLVTADFGNRTDLGNPYLLGVVYSDANHDGLYSQGEGLGGVTITFAGSAGRFSTMTTPAGGYQIQLPDGTYTVTASGGGLGAARTKTATIHDANVQLDFTTDDGSGAAPAAPQGVSATAVSSTQVRLSWNAVSGANGYTIWQWSGGKAVQIGTYGAGTISVNVNNLQPGTTNYFAVGAYNSAGSNFSSWVSVVTPSQSAPAAPTGLMATALSTTQLRLTWNAVVGAGGYTIRQWVGGKWIQIGNFGAGTTNVTVSNLGVGSTNYFDVGAYNGAGTTFSAYVIASTLTAAPTGLMAGVLSGTQVQLSWNGVSGATGYTVRQWVNGKWVVIGTFGAGTTRVVVSNLSPGGTYYFDVGADDRAGTDFSGWVSVRT